MTTDLELIREMTDAEVNREISERRGSARAILGAMRRQQKIVVTITAKTNE